MTAHAIYKLYKNDRHCQVIGIGKHSENLEDMFICKAYTPRRFLRRANLVQTGQNTGRNKKTENRSFKIIK